MYTLQVGVTRNNLSFVGQVGDKPKDLYLTFSVLILDTNLAPHSSLTPKNFKLVLLDGPQGPSSSVLPDSAVSIVPQGNGLYSVVLGQSDQAPLLYGFDYVFAFQILEARGGSSRKHSWASNWFR